MVKYLEELLHAKTKDSQSSILFAQWSYDKKIVPAALQAVSNLFPHYSLHDESHSATIINNIIRILGKDNFVKLSSIDIWLILEAAYWHDLGMVVSGEKMVESLKSPDFLQFLSEIIDDKKHSLHEFAVKFEVVDGKLKSKDSFYSLELNDSIKYILAEFFRWRHADRSKDIVNNPLGEIHIVSPRGVIPQRIIKILGDICSCHTKNFVDVMKLPFCEVGIDIEDAHPRFVACLLRIGDLLDLDNNRFSEVMLRTLTRIPTDTVNHKAKHLSIESFRVDRERIDITANCEDYETANIAQHWFNYLNSEISNQMINWNNIVPSKDLGYLPTIGTLKVELKNYDLIDGKQKPQFSVDTDKALALLQGAGIYDGAYQAIREIMQNSVDSSLIRVWLEHKNDTDLTSPLSEEFRSVVANYAVSVSITKGLIEGEWRNWMIEIHDKGTGISQNDIKYIMNTGSSSKNYDRINIINQMPLWMKPSGTFGIGFQSVFMLTDEVLIETKSFFDEQARLIELNSPNSQKDGGILIKKRHSDHSTKPGLKIKFNHKAKAIPNAYSVSFNSKASDIAHNYDPFSHDSLDVEMGKIIDEIIEFAQKSYFPINLTFDGDAFNVKTKVRPFSYYDEETCLELNIVANDENHHRNLDTYYKNQKVENKLKDFNFLGFELNIHKDVASSVLTLNRNKIRDDYYDTLYQDVLHSSFRIIMSNFAEFFSEHDRVLASMFLDYYSHHEKMTEYDIAKYNNWKSLNFTVEGTDYNLGDIMSRINTLHLIYIKSDVARKELYSLDGDTLTIELVSEWSASYITKFIIKKISKEFKGGKKQLYNQNGLRQISLFRDNPDSPLMSFEDVIQILKNTDHFGARTTIPCTEEFFALRLKKNAHKSYLRHYRPDYHFTMDYPQMLSPFVLKSEHRKKDKYEIVLNTNIYDWVFENRFDQKTTKKDIIKCYDDFCAKANIEEVNIFLQAKK